jgi:Baseplate J-like protein
VTVLPPKVDRRPASEVVKQVQDLLKVYTPDLDVTRGPGAALTGIFGRFAELIIERLNQVPQKNFLAYLDLLGASLMPPQPSRVPLTFSLAAGSAVDGLVPAGTQVAAIPAEGETAPIIFETERELVVTAARLTSVFVRNPEQDQYADLSLIANSTSAYGVPGFLGNRPIEHMLYLGHDQLFSHPGLNELAVRLVLSSIPNQDRFDVVWEIWDGVQWIEMTKHAPLPDDGLVKISLVAPLVPRKFFGLEKRWLRCRLLTPINAASEERQGMVRADHIPSINSITIQAKSSRDNMAIESAFGNSTPLDTSKEFFPFGEKPRLGDALYLSIKEAFSDQNTAVTIHILLANPAVVPAPPPVSPPPPVDTPSTARSAAPVSPSIPPVEASNDLMLIWEFWDGRTWAVLGTVGPTDKGSRTDLLDTTKAFTANGNKEQSGSVSFTFRNPPVATTVNGVESFWIRVRIAKGNYGVEAKYEAVVDPKPNEPAYRLIPATYKPPVISSITVDYTLIKSASPELVLAYNDFAYEDFTRQTFKPFRPTRDDRPTLYLGFTLPDTRPTFPNRKISLFSALDEFKHAKKFVPISPIRSKLSGTPNSTLVHTFQITNPLLQPVTFVAEVIGSRWDTSAAPQEITLGLDETGAKIKTKELQVSVIIPGEPLAESRDRGYLMIRLKSDSSIAYAAAFETFVGEQIPTGERVQLTWEYTQPTGWAKLLVRDESANLSRPGMHEFLAPPDFSTRDEFGLTRYWLRTIWNSGQYLYDPVLHGLRLNTIMAAQAVTIKNELLGSSDASKNQKFRATRAPILEGQQLEVREPEMPPASEQERIRQQEGEDAISVVRDEAGRPKEIWVRWSQMPDFYGSEARDRHYIIDHLTGEIRFGDGLNGLIPPTGSGNLRLARYQTGGGTASNKPAGTITQLKTTVPYVEKVTNFIAATGGAAAETLESLLERAPRTIRHRDRAVTVEDYEDLAMLASPEVARAKCEPLHNLAIDAATTLVKPGAVSLIVVPRSTDAKPTPSLELLNRVSEFIGDRQIPVVDLTVVGPSYVCVSIKTEIAPVSLEGESDIKLAVDRELSRFLHPLTGGLDGKGWDFGRKPYKSDLYALIEMIAGVDYVRALEVNEVEESKGASATNRFLVYSGTHAITLKFEET